MYLHAYVPYLLSEFIPLCSTKTWLSVQNCITPLEGRHQFSRRKQILVEKMISRLLLFQSPSNLQVRRTGIKSWTSLNYGQFWSNTLKLHARVTVPQVSDYWASCFTILSVFLSICLKNACIHVHVVCTCSVVDECTCSVCRINEPVYDTNKMTCPPSKDSDQTGLWSKSSLCTQWAAKDPMLLHVNGEDCNPIGRMPRLIWVFTGCTDHVVGFVVLRLKILLISSGSWFVCIKTLFQRGDNFWRSTTG